MTPDFFQKALEIAARIVDPTSAAVFCAVVACIAFWLAFKQKDKKIIRTVEIILGVGIIFLGALPHLSKIYLNTHGVYEIRIVVLGLNKAPVDNSTVVCAPGGEKKSIDGGWECDLPPRNRPSDRVFTAYASEKSAFLFGTGRLQLSDDYNPQLTIQLQSDTSATVQGEVLGKQNRVLAGAWVSVVGQESERVQTGPAGGFVLHTHAAQGQMIQMHAEADGYRSYEGLQQAGDTSISIRLTP